MALNSPEGIKILHEKSGSQTLNLHNTFLSSVINVALNVTFIRNVCVLPTTTFLFTSMIELFGAIHQF